MEKIWRNRPTLLLLASGIIVAVPALARADTPYQVADSSTATNRRSVPEVSPPPPQRFSIALSGLYTTRRGETAGWAPSLEVNYQATDNLQLHAMAPYAFDRVTGGPTHFGPGDFELGMRYRFIEPDEGWRPAVSFYPLIDFPTGDERRGLGTGTTHVFLPLWVAKNFGDWTPYAGGGYWFNRGDGNKDWIFLDAGAQRRISDSLSLYGEVYHATSSKNGLKETTGFNVGGTYNFTANHHVVLSVGRGLQNAEDTNQFTTYVAYLLTF